MSLSNKLTLDKVDVNGKRVVMRYVSCFPPTQLIGCGIICRLISEMPAHTWAAGFQKRFGSNVTKTASKQGPTTGLRPDSRKRTAHVFLRATCPWGDAAWMQQTHVVGVVFSGFPHKLSSLVSFVHHSVSSFGRTTLIFCDLFLYFSEWGVRLGVIWA